MYRLLVSLLAAPAEATELSPGGDNYVTELVLLCHSATVGDILLREELEELARKAAGRLRVVHVVGTQPDELPPPGGLTLTLILTLTLTLT